MINTFVDELKELGFEVVVNLTTNPPVIVGTQKINGVDTKFTWKLVEGVRIQSIPTIEKFVDRQTNEFWRFYLKQRTSVDKYYRWSIHDVQWVLDELKMSGRVLSDGSEIDWSLNPEETILDVLNRTKFPYYS